MGNSFWLSWEPGFIEFLQSFVNPILQKFLEIITFFGDKYAMILLLGFLYWGYNKELGKKISLYAVTALLSCVTLNNIVMRRRPYFDHKSIQCLKPRSSAGDPYNIVIQGYSFPSGHATNSISTYVALGLNIKNVVLKIILFVSPLIIAFSRLALGVHYPTDILAGWLISAIVIFVLSRIKNSYIVYGIMVALGVAGCFFSNSDDYYSSLGIAFGFIAAFIFEEKLVHFENTKSVFRMILRTIGGLAIFVVVDTVLKLPFSAEVLTSVTPLAFCIRTVRYTIASFVVIGVYPMCFQFFTKKFPPKQKKQLEETK